jgi:hypothetical protein
MIAVNEMDSKTMKTMKRMKRMKRMMILIQAMHGDRMSRP